MKRVRFQVWPQSEIEAGNRTLINLLFSKNQHKIFPFLRDFLEENINQPLDTEFLRNALSDKKFGFRNWQLDPTLKATIRKQNKRYLSTYIPFGVGGEKIIRRETASIIKEIDDESGKQIILLTGVAGCGKSGIIRGVIEHLQSTKCIHLAFRVDHYLNCSTPEEICSKLLDRNESPVITLQGVSEDKPGVLIVDQVDAVSEISGRNGATKNAILEFLDGIHELTTKIIYVCRDFDLENDARFRTLAQKDIVLRIKVDLLDFEKDVIPILERRGVNTGTFSKSQKDLLKLPLNLALFLEIGDISLKFKNRDDLFDELIKKKSNDLVQHSCQWSLMQPLIHVSTWMSEHQKLSAPISMLDNYPQAINILGSESLIVVTDKEVNFFHESFFDYVYARNFLNSNKSIFELISSEEQHLFRRTQVRQILEVLRQHDRLRYLRELKKLFSFDVRYHIRIAVAKWLGTLTDPSEQECDFAYEFQSEKGGFSPLARSILLGSAGWFDIHSKSSWLLTILNGKDEGKRNLVLRWLLQIAHERPQGVTDVLRLWWGKDSRRASELLNRISFIRAKDMGDKAKPIGSLCCDLLDSVPEGLFADKTMHRRDFILHSWATGDLGNGANILKSYFKCWFKAHPGKQPFYYNSTLERDLHTLSQGAKRSPSEFILGILQTLDYSIDIINKNNWDTTFSSFEVGSRVGDDRLVIILKEALLDIAESAPELAIEYLIQLEPNRHKLYLHLHLETVVGNPEFFKDHFLTLTEYEGVMSAGNKGVEWRSFARAAKSILPYTNDEERGFIEKKIATYRPELDDIKKILNENIGENYKKWALDQLKRSGFEQWCILEEIGIDHIPFSLKRLLKELRRKFINEEIASPSKSVVIRGIYSPIPIKHARFMTNQQWLKAIEKYQNHRDWRGRHDNGGVEELSNVLGECTKESPDRFVHVFRALSHGTNTLYPSKILYGIGQSKGCKLENIKLIIDCAEDYPDRPFGKEICNIIAQYPLVCEEKKYLKILIDYGVNETVNDEDIFTKDEDEKKDEEVSGIQDFTRYMQRASIPGMNSVRGAAVRALTQVYWKFPKYSAQVEKFILNRIDKETSTSVRCTILELLLPVYNHSKKKCAECFHDLVKQSKSEEDEVIILTSFNGVKLLRHLLPLTPVLSNNLIDILIRSRDKKARLIGAWVIFVMRYEQEEYEGLYEMLLDISDEHRRIAAEVAAQWFSEVEFQDKAVEHLKRFFNDRDETVRKNASVVFGQIPVNQVYKHIDLIEAYISSNASLDDMAYFLDLLKNATVNVSEYVILCAEKMIVDLKEVENFNQFTTHGNLSSLEELIKNGYAASEYDPELRQRYLNIIDDLLQMEVYWGERMVASHDRH
ncbi:MAG: AAA family ATPase [Lewinella sp.]|uniref:AAA family ATPase n=1 Tax=Lewinella sp. TaxID=2004506 RepID=UPI003D6C3736